MKFNSLTELQEHFRTGKMKELPVKLSIDGINFKQSHKRKDYDFIDIINGVEKPMVIYTLDPKTENKARYNEKHTNHDDPNSIQDTLVFVWAPTRLLLKPAIVKNLAKERINMVIVREAGDPNDDRDIGTKLEVVLSTFNANKPIDAKVDTGAEMCSMRVNNLKVNERQGVCSFNFYNKNITMSYDGFQSVKVGDAVENRPLVKFNVVVPTKDPNTQDIVVNNVQFNLNDVPDHQIVKGDEFRDLLLGMNFINAGKFRVVGSAQTTEDIDWNALQELFKDVEAPIEEGYELEGFEANKVRRAIELLKEII